MIIARTVKEQLPDLEVEQPPKTVLKLIIQQAEGEQR